MTTRFVGTRIRGACVIMRCTREGLTSLRGDTLRDWKGLDLVFDWGDLSAGSELTASALLLYSGLGGELFPALVGSFLAEVVAVMPLLDWELAVTEVQAWAVDRMRRDRFAAGRAAQQWQLSDFLPATMTRPEGS